MIKNSEDKMCIGEIVETNTSKKKVWFCISCKRHYISDTIPTDCPCHKGMFVIDTTKRVE